MRDVARFSSILLLFCVVSAGLLAFIYRIAEPRIVEQRQLEEARAIEEVLTQPPEKIEKVQAQDLVFYKAMDLRDNLTAYIFIAASRGYAGQINTVVSLTPQGDIIGVKVLEQHETPGVGTRISEDSFLNQFKNRNINEDFDTITGATISSTALIHSIKQKAREILEYER